MRSASTTRHGAYRRRETFSAVNRTGNLVARQVEHGILLSVLIFTPSFLCERPTSDHGPAARGRVLRMVARRTPTMRTADAHDAHATDAHGRTADGHDAHATVATCCRKSFRHRIPQRVLMNGLQRMLWEFSAAKSLHPTRCLHVRHDILTSNSWQHRCDMTCDLPPIHDAIEKRLGTENARKIP